MVVQSCTSRPLALALGGNTSNDSPVIVRPKEEDVVRGFELGLSSGTVPVPLDLLVEAPEIGVSGWISLEGRDGQKEVVEEERSRVETHQIWGTSDAFFPVTFEMISR